MLRRDSVRGGSCVKVVVKNKGEASRHEESKHEESKHDNIHEAYSGISPQARQHFAKPPRPNNQQQLQNRQPQLINPLINPERKQKENADRDYLQMIKDRNHNANGNKEHNEFNNLNMAEEPNLKMAEDHNEFNDLNMAEEPNLKKIKPRNLRMVKERLLHFNRNFLAFHPAEKLLLKNLIIYELMRSATTQSLSSCQVEVPRRNLSTVTTTSVQFSVSDKPPNLLHPSIKPQRSEQLPTSSAKPSTITDSNPSNLQQAYYRVSTDPSSPFELALEVSEPNPNRPPSDFNLNGNIGNNKFLGDDSMALMTDSTANDPVNNLPLEDVGENLMKLPRSDWLRIVSLGGLVLDVNTIEKCQDEGGHKIQNQIRMANQNGNNQNESNRNDRASPPRPNPTGVIFAGMTKHYQSNRNANRSGMSKHQAENRHGIHGNVRQGVRV
jgi:hypothetical protein